MVFPLMKLTLSPSIVRKRKDKEMENTTQNQTELPNINIGKVILNDLQEEGRTVVWLAKKLGVARTSVYYHLNADSFSLEMLWNISIAMKHNYLADYATAIDKQITSMNRKR